MRSTVSPPFLKMMEIFTIYARGFGANTYVITEDHKNAIVIDPAQPRVEGELIKLGLTPTSVLLTHCHFDHVMGVPALQQGGARVYSSAEEKPIIGTSVDLYDRFHAPRIPFSVDETFVDGEEKILNGISVKMLLTPGHTQGSCSYLITSKEGDRYLFTGDTLFLDSVGRTDFPTGNISQLRASLRKLCALDGDMPVYAGHGEETTLDRERKRNPFIKDM